MIKDREFYFSFPTFYFSDHLNSITMEPINTKHHSLWNIQPRRNNYPSESILLLMKNSLVINHSYRNIPINSWDSWFDLSLIHFFFVVPPRISSVREKFHPFFFSLCWKSLRQLRRLRNPGKSSVETVTDVFSDRSTFFRHDRVLCLDRSIRYANAWTINGGRPTFLRDVY